MLHEFGLNSPGIYPKTQIGNQGDRPASIMPSTEGFVHYTSFERLVEQASSHVEMWTRSGDHHLTTTDFLHSRKQLEYAHHVLHFLKHNLCNLPTSTGRKWCVIGTDLPRVYPYGITTQRVYSGPSLLLTSTIDSPRSSRQETADFVDSYSTWCHTNP